MKGPVLKHTATDDDDPALVGDEAEILVGDDEGGGTEEDDEEKAVRRDLTKSVVHVDVFSRARVTGLDDEARPRVRLHLCDDRV